MMKPHPIERRDARALGLGISRRLLLASASAVLLRPSMPAAQPAATDPLLTLVAVMRARLNLMVEVARSKWNSAASVEDLAREQHLTQRVTDLAPRYRLDPQLAATFFRAQIEAAKLVESALIARWTQAHEGTFAEASDSVAAIRPKIDRLTEELLAGLAAVAPGLKRDDGVRIVEAARSSDEVMTLAMTRALQPLLELCRVKAGG